MDFGGEHKMAEEIKDKTPNAEDLINRAIAAAGRLEAANKRAEELASIAVLGGKSEASIPPVPVDKEKEETDRINAMLKPLGLHI